MAISLIRKVAQIAVGGDMPAGVYNATTGSWDLGPALGGVQNSANGTAFLIRSATSSSSAATMALMPGDVAASSTHSFIQVSDGTSDHYGLGVTGEGNHLIIGARASNPRHIFFVNGSPTRIQVGKIDAAGEWSIGTTTLNNAHKIYGRLGISTTNLLISQPSNVQLQIEEGTVTNKGPYLWLRSTYGAGGTQASLVLGVDNASSIFSGDCCAISCQDQGQMQFLHGNGTSYDVFGQISSTGGWTFGTTAVGAQTMLFRGGQGVTFNMFSGQNTGGSGFTIQLQDGASPLSQIGHISTVNAYQVRVGGAGGVQLTSGATAWAAISDSRLKRDISDMNYGLAQVMELRPVFYNYISDVEAQERRLGFIAQEVMTQVPELVTDTEYGKLDDSPSYYSLDTTNMVPVLVKAIQELKAEFDAYVATHP